MKQVIMALLCMTVWGLAKGQPNITAAEYFFDTDPGMGAGTPVTGVTVATDISSLAFNANVSALPYGMHTLYLRTKNANGVWSQTEKLSIARVQGLLGNPHTATNITKLEYYFDTDPGYNNGADVPITPTTNLSSFAFNANVGSLAQGMHTLYVRSRDAAGFWSIVNMTVFASVRNPLYNPHAASNIVKVEYFYDADPGVGNGTNVPVTAATDVSNLVFNADVSALNGGLHTLYVRTRDANGFWSMTSLGTFAKLQGLSGNPHSVSNIVKAEYFYDTDPGMGNGTNIPVTPATDISGIVFNADVSALGDGVHTLYVRTKDAGGFWSMANLATFAKVKGIAGNPHTVSNITKAEYYFDTDPGAGNGTDIPVTAATDINGFVLNANVAALGDGVHILYIRTRDAQGKWSLTANSAFAKVKAVSPNPHTVSNIVYAEYFMDTDPGPGNGGYIALTPATDIANLNFNVDLTVYPNQVHRLFVRTRDAQGKWSITNIHTFTGGTAPLAVKFLSFDAQAQGNRTVRLDWVTAMESNVKHYTIHRSYDAVNWTLVGTQAPLAASSNEQHTYTMVDENPGSGLTYYRLTETDLNGKETHAPIRFVRMSGATVADAALYPNPGDGRSVTVRSSMLAAGETLLSVISLDGKVHLRQTIQPQANGEVQLHDMNLPAGSYFINLQNENQTASLRWQVLGSE